MEGHGRPSPGSKCFIHSLVQATVSWCTGDLCRLGPVHWQLTKERLPTMAIPGDAADDLSLRILFCRPARGAAFNLLAGSCSKHVYSASSKPPINGEGVRDLHLCPLPPSPALPLAEPAGPPDSVCPQRSFFFFFSDTTRAESNGVHYPLVDYLKGFVFQKHFKA